MPTEFYLIIITTLIFTILMVIWLCYLLNTDMFLKFGLSISRSYVGMKVRHIKRKNGRGIWCYAEKGRKSHRFSKQRLVRKKLLEHQKQQAQQELLAQQEHEPSKLSFLGSYETSSSDQDSGTMTPCHQMKCQTSCEKTSEKQINEASPSTLVFLHGFGGDKDTWPNILKSIPSTYHCIVLDMPGHGDTTFDETIDEPNIESYVKSLREFLEITGLDQEKIYLIGCSFGGAVAALFANTYPNLVGNLALLCPAIKTPVITDTCQELMNGNFNLLIPENGEQFITMISLLCHKTQYYPKRIMQSFVNLNFTPERKSLLKKLLHNLLTDQLENFENDLQHRFNDIKMPTLIIWGENDNILHVSGAKLLNEKIVNSEIKIISNCNHVLQLDEPRKTSEYILEFIKKRN